MNFVLKLPEFYHPIVRGEHFKAAAMIIQELDGVDLLIELN